MTVATNNFPFVWVSPYAIEDRSGGWRMMSYQLRSALESAWGPALRIAPVEVPEDPWAKWFSRFQKLLHVPRRYAYYSEERLAAFARLLESRIPTQNQNPIFFFGALPFVHYRPQVPYWIYSDGSFAIHYHDYNQDHSHAPAEIDRICHAEREFLNGAARVFLSSAWAAQRIQRDYGLSAEKFQVVGTGPGNMPEPPATIRYNNVVLMVVTDFERKGGRVAFECIQECRRLGLDVTIQYIGATPPPEILQASFVEYLGWLDLKKPEERERFVTALAQCGAVLLPSRRDLTPLVILDAACYSKAVIATAVGGISEMIKDGQTGLLISPESSPAEMARRVVDLFQDRSRLAQMGQSARQWQEQEWSWCRVAEKLASSVDLGGGVNTAGEEARGIRL